MSSADDRASESLAWPSEIGGPARTRAIAAAGVDPLSDVLRRVRLAGAVFFMVEATSPWCVEVPRADAFAATILPRAQHVVSYHIVVAGSGSAWLAGGEPVPLAAGDIIVFAHGDGYAMASAPALASQLTREESLQFFRELAAGRLPFVIEEGGGGPERLQVICGFLGCDAHPFNPLLAALPRLLKVTRVTGGSDLLDRLIELTIAEANRRRAGGDCIRTGLGELMFVELLRRHLDAPQAAAGGWFAGLRDPAVGRALSLLHERPDAPWTLTSLARAVGVSRSVLAERFTRLVGCPPIAYLTRWRMQVAAERLAEPGAQVASVAAAVGYASEAAFSRTFKRVAGVSPAAWRRSTGRAPAALAAE